MSNRQEHWEQTYKTKSETAVSWFQAVPAKSLQLIRQAIPDTCASIIDIGGGASSLPDSLLKEGYGDITVLDISDTALSRSRERLGVAAERINWIVADITAWMPSHTWDVWHDRAVFHFLTDADAQDHYIAALRRGTQSGSTAIISTFALDGPERCSGLPVQRYSPETLAKRIGAPFVLKDQYSERHATPGGSVQNFSYAVLTRP